MATWRAPVLLALLTLTTSPGCAALTHPRRTVAPPRGVETGAVDTARCGDLAVLAAIDVYPMGLNPRRPFEAVGTVETGLEGSAMQRVASLQAQACALGANAVIGWSEEGLGRGLAAAFQDGATILSVPDGRPVTASGIAVVYTDVELARRDEAGDADLWAPSPDL